MVLKGAVVSRRFCMPKGHFVRTPEHRANIKKALTGMKRTPETCERISKAKTGHKMPPGFAENQSARLKGKPSGRVWTDELSATMTAAKLGKCGRLKAYGISKDEYELRKQAGEKWCGHGKHFSQKENFGNKASVCGECLPEYSREMNLTRLFGVNHEWYLKKLEEQGGVCAICRTATQKDSSGGKHFGVDHSHASQAIRGLLCFRCNSALERLDAIPDWCMRATAYLEKYANEEPFIPMRRKHKNKYVRARKESPASTETIPEPSESLPSVVA